MAQLSFDAPLKWPEAYPITPRMRQRADSGFSNAMTLEEAVSFLAEEIMDFDTQYACLCTDVENIATARTRHAHGTRSGACLTLKIANKNYFFACDRWQKLEHNIYALHLTLRQLRNIDKWGTAPLELLLSQFAVSNRHALDLEKLTSESTTSWMQALGLGPTATLQDAVAVYHRRAKQIGNSDDTALTILNEAMQQAREALGQQ